MEDFSKAKEYFARSGVQDYIEDALLQLLIARDANPTIDCRSFLLHYFGHVKCGTHTTLREYDYVSLTSYNRLSFLINMWKSYQSLEQCKVHPNEFYSLAQLLCPDLPKRLVIRTVAALKSGQKDVLSTTFAQLYRVFQFHMFFEEFVTTLIHSLTIQNSNGNSHDEEKRVQQSLPCMGDGAQHETPISKLSTCAAYTQTELWDDVVHPDDGLYVSTASFKRLVPEIFIRPTFALPSKQIIRICSRELLKYPTLNLDRFFFNLANETLLATEAGLPQISIQ